jgi:hypothetical protein
MNRFCAGVADYSTLANPMRHPMKTTTEDDCEYIGRRSNDVFTSSIALIKTIHLMDGLANPNLPPFPARGHILDVAVGILWASHASLF